MLNSICRLPINLYYPIVRTHDAILNDGSRVKRSLKKSKLKSERGHESDCKQRFDDCAGLHFLELRLRTADAISGRACCV